MILHVSCFLTKITQVLVVQLNASMVFFCFCGAEKSPEFCHLSGNPVYREKTLHRDVAALEPMHTRSCLTA